MSNYFANTIQGEKGADPSSSQHLGEEAPFKDKQTSDNSQRRKSTSLIGGFDNKSTSVRIVWRNESTVDIDNISKVLRIPKRKRSLSPALVANQIENEDSILSEDFNPLSIKRTASTDYLDEQDSAPLFSEERPSRLRTRPFELEIVNMPSVKNLKSIFEKSISQSKADSPEPYSRKSRPYSGSLEYVKDAQSDAKRTHKKEESKKINFSKKPLEKSKSYGGIDRQAPMQSTPIKTNKEANIQVKQLTHFFERSMSTPSISGVGLNEGLREDKDYIAKSQSSFTLEKRAEIPQEKSIPETQKNVQESKSGEEAQSSSSPQGGAGDAFTKGLSVLRLKEKWEKAVRERSEKQHKAKMLEREKVEKIENEKKAVRVEKMKKEITESTFKESEVSVHYNTPKSSASKVEDTVANFVHNTSDNKTDTKKDEIIKKKVNADIIENKAVSVRDITKLYESKKLSPRMRQNSISKSSPAIAQMEVKRETSEEVINEKVSNVSVSSTTSSNPSPITSNKVNPRSSSKPLENLKKNFTTGVPPKTQVTSDTKKNTSFGTLERTASVRLLLSRFEKISNKRSDADLKPSSSLTPTVKREKQVRDRSATIGSYFEAGKEVKDQSSSLPEPSPIKERSESMVKLQYESKIGEIKDVKKSVSSTKLTEDKVSDKPKTPMPILASDSNVKSVTNYEKKEVNEILNRNDDRSKISSESEPAMDTKKESAEKMEMLPIRNSIPKPLGEATSQMNGPKENVGALSYPSGAKLATNETGKVAAKQAIATLSEDESTTIEVSQTSVKYSSTSKQHSDADNDEKIQGQTTGQSSSQKNKVVKEDLTNQKSSEDSDDRNDDSPVTTRAMRSLSTSSSVAKPPGKFRDLKEDELKIFQGSFKLSQYGNATENERTRDRSSTVASSTPSQEENKNLLKSPQPRDQSSKFRQLHADELKYFGGLSPPPGVEASRQRSSSHSLLAQTAMAGAKRKVEMQHSGID